MKKYDDRDVLRYFKKHIGYVKSRKPKYLDPRDYVIALLYYKFGWSEKNISELLKPISRCSINHSKKNPYFHLLINNEKFLEHTKEIRKKFPYVFPHPKNMPRKKYHMTLMFDKDDYNKLKVYAQLKDKHINHAAKDLIKKAIRLWEE